MEQLMSVSIETCKLIFHAYAPSLMIIIFSLLLYNMPWYDMKKMFQYYWIFPL